MFAVKGIRTFALSLRRLYRFALATAGKCQLSIQNPLRCRDSPILGFFKKGESAQIGVREMNPAKRLCESPSRFAPHKARPGPDHGMAPPHNVDIADEFSNLRMRLREVVENKIRPGFPIGIQQSLAFTLR